MLELPGGSKSCSEESGMGSVKASGDESRIMLLAASNGGGEGALAATAKGQGCLLARALDALGDGLAVVDGRGVVSHLNRGFARLIGRSTEEVLGQNLAVLNPGSAVMEVVRTGRPLRDKTVWPGRGGEDLKGDIFPVWHGGRVVGAVALVRCSLVASSEEPGTPGALPEPFNHLVGKNERFLEALALAAQVAPTDATVLIMGESGVGKELLARAIHHSSRRRDKPLVKVNCAAIPETLLESELFGYVEGAFTGAKRGGRIGKFELANQGTLFLDEIGDMSLAMQAKLLRVIQEREIEKVGSNWTVKVDIRIIAATNQNLKQMVEAGRFREDLYYRLNVVEVHLPPLRERRDDIPLLAGHLLKHFNEVHHKNLSFSPEVIDLLVRHRWPGNVRELCNLVEHMVIVGDSALITPRHFPRSFELRAGPAGRGGEERKLGEQVAELERRALEEALRACNHNRTRAMELLGISRRTFYKKLKLHNLI